MQRWAMIGSLAAMLLAAPGHAQENDESQDDDIIFLTPDMVPGETPLRPGEPPTPPKDETALARTLPPSVLAIFAHPDDEITIAPVLARIAREGGSVTLAFATSGEAGPGVSGMDTGEELSALRENEARCSAFALGLPEPIFWQFGDGTLADFARRENALALDLRDRIAGLIAVTDPKIVMTWGPDGGYGHADHRMISNAVTEVVQAMGEDRPDLLYPALPASEDIPSQLADWATTHVSLVTDRIHYQFVDLEAARIGIDCHQSQFDEQARAYLPDLLHRGVWRGMVHFRLAFPSTR